MLSTQSQTHMDVTTPWAEHGQGSRSAGFPLRAISSLCLGMSLNLFIFQALKLPFPKINKWN